MCRDQVAGIFNSIRNNLGTVATGGNVAGGGSAGPDQGGGDQTADYDVADPMNGTAFAVYSADDNSLDFYKRKGMPDEGSVFCGRTATKIYPDLEQNGGYWVGKWANRTDIKKVEVVDYGISPEELGSCFFGDTSLEKADMFKLGTSNLQSVQAVFANCTSLNEVNCGNWDTSKVGNMQAVFFNCSSLKTVSLYNWTVKDGLNMSCMFKGCTNLYAVSVGSNWQWTGVGGESYLPAQTASNSAIQNADGKWYAGSTGIGYKPSEIPSKKADTYLAWPR